jgi:hypothetical protein
MLTRILTGAALALAASLCVAGAANAGVVTFEDGKAFSCSSGTQSSGGMSFAQDFYACFYSKTVPEDFPTGLSSEVMAVGYVDTLMSRDDASVFNLSTVDLAFGPFDHAGLTSDITTLTANFHDGSTASMDLSVGFGFQRYNIDWTNLDSVNFSQLHASGEYLAFDNIAYDGATAPPMGGIPEPTIWATLLTGFFGMGAMIRRNRRALAYAKA